MSQRFAPAIRAAFWMSGALVSFMAMAIAGRQLSTELTTFQVLFFRSLVGLAVVTALLHRAGWRHVKTHVIGTHLLRNIAHFGGQYGWFYGIALIPLTEVFAIEFTVPIWTALMATFLLHERMTGCARFCRCAGVRRRARDSASRRYSNQPGGARGPR